MVVLQEKFPGPCFQVCLVERKGDKKKFAMKYVKKETCVAMCAVKNVIEEVDLLRSLDHPFISSIWYTFQVLEAIFVFCAFMYGETHRIVSGCGRFIHSS